MTIGKKVFSTLMLAGAAIAADAQSVSYKVTTNDANDFQRSALYLDLFSADTYLSPTIGSAVKAETMVGNVIMPWVQVRYAWLDAATHHVVSGYPTNAGGQKKQLTTELGGALFLTGKVKTKRLKVVLSSHKSGNTTYTKYLQVPGEIKRMMGVRGGININRKALEFEDKSHDYYHYKDVLTGVEQPIGSVGNGTSISPAGEFYNPLSMSTIFTMFAGLHIRKVTNLSIYARDWGTKSNRKVVDLYADVMLTPAVPIANVVDIAGREYELVKLDGAIRRIGWRAGCTTRNSQKVGLEYNFEFGQKPGPVMGKSILENGTFISLNMGMSIGSRKFIGVNKKKKADAPVAPAAQ